MKRCSKCGNEHPATSEYFSKHASGKDGLRACCKECATEHHRQFRKDNPECDKQWREKNPEYFKLRSESNPEYRKQYYANNKEAMRQKSKQWSENNPILMAQYRKKWTENNRSLLTIKEQRRRARERQLPSTLTAVQWNQIKEEFNGECAYCGEKKPLTQEHFMPLSKGGEYTHNNIIPSCQSCNSSKGATNFLEWYPLFKHYSKLREQKILKYLNYSNGIQQLALL